MRPVCGRDAWNSWRSSRSRSALWWWKRSRSSIARTVRKYRRYGCARWPRRCCGKSGTTSRAMSVENCCNADIWEVTMKRSAIIASSAALLVACPFVALAQDKISDGVVKIGMLEDMSSIYADITGVGEVPAAKMAVEELGGKVLGKPIEVVAADHQNKPDIASAVAREWFDIQHVDALMDVAASATALAAIE